MQDQHRCLTRILVLGKACAGDHADHRLAQHLLVTAIHGVGGVLTTRRCGLLHLLTCQSLDRDLLHGNSLYILPTAR